MDIPFLSVPFKKLHPFLGVSVDEFLQRTFLDQRTALLTAMPQAAALDPDLMTQLPAITASLCMATMDDLDWYTRPPVVEASTEVAVSGASQSADLETHQQLF